MAARVTRARAPKEAPAALRFIGRARDLAWLAESLDAPGTLVTLTGPGGMGKTRLARELLRLLAEPPARREPSSGRRGKKLPPAPGVFVDLTEARDVSELCAAVGRALAEVRPSGTDSDRGLSAATPVLTVGRQLGRCGDLLVVLDNFEQLVTPAATVVAEWRSMAARARFLVTSRESLRISNERVRELSPLGLPEEGEVGASESVELLVDRIRRVLPDYAPSAEEIGVAALLVRELDGIPLAIELAATRVGALGLSAVAARLSARLDHLGHGPRDVARRQQTLFNALEWSWSLLRPEERAALAQCSVFRGGFTLEAAEAVVDVSGCAPGTSVVDLLCSLRAKSLLTAPTSGREFGMYLVIRSFAEAKLAERADEIDTQTRHARFAVAQAEV